MRFAKDPVTLLLRWRIGLRMIQRLRNAFNRRLESFRASLAKRIAPNGRVIAGPFAGMAFPMAKLESSVVLPKLLSCYEEELHPILETIMQANYSDVIDIGCGDGYYAVGLAMRMPAARVLALDVDPPSRAATQQLADLNQLADRVQVRAECTPEQLRNLRLGPRLFILSDCEGAEIDLIHPAALPNSARIDLLVECHDSTSYPNVAALLSRRFSSTHDAEIISSRARDPSIYPELDGWSSGEIEMALSESRPPGMKWLFLRQKDRPNSS